jgi:hypothetical protein
LVWPLRSGVGLVISGAMARPKKHPFGSPYRSIDLADHSASVMPRRDPNFFS